jgi:hypothetical protein
MQMICIADGREEEYWGPYTDLALAERILAIVQSFDPGAELVSKETDQWAKEIISGKKPWKIHIDIVNGELQLPATVSLTWPPQETEGLQIGTPDYQEFFVWAKNEKVALLNLARINRAAPTEKEAVKA